MMLRMVLFGVPHLYIGTTDLSKVITGRSLALLVYLAVTGKTQDRTILADLLWDNLPEAQAKKNLRYVLYDLRQAIGDHLLVSRQTIAFHQQGHYWLDVEVFSAYLHAEAPNANVELYKEVLDLRQGEFLDGFYIQDAPIFEEWLAARRRQFHTQVVHGLHLLTQEYLVQRKYEVGLQLTQRLLTLEPWNEEAHRQQMRLLAYSGRRSAALAQYEVCRRALATEYSAEPLFETTQLYAEIKAGRFAKAAERCGALSLPFSNPLASATQPPIAQPEPGVTLPATTQVNWDAIPVPPRLFGRTQDLMRLEQWISGEGCRLLSLSGLGGQGKSTLAAEVVRRLADRAEEQPADRLRRRSSKTAAAPQPFDAIFWCSLAGIASFSQLIAYWWRWCGVLAGLTDLECIAEDTPLEEQLAYLLRYLRQQRCLLVLDQLEHVLQPGLFTGAYNQGWEHFPELLRRVAESEHQSCLLLISREELPEFTYLTRHTSAVRTLPLQGLTTADSVAMLRSHGFAGPEHLLADLAQHYAGLPSALTCVGAMYRRLPSDQLSTLLMRDTPLFDELHKLLAQQVRRLSVLEQEILFWLAFEQTAVSVEYFWQTFNGSGAKGHMVDAYQSLARRSLLQVEQSNGCVQLPTLVLRYIIQQIIDSMVAELSLAWESMTQAPSAFAPELPAYDVPMNHTSPARYLAVGVAEAFANPLSLWTERRTEQQGLLQTYTRPEAALPVAEKALAVARPLPFTLLRRYRLVNPNASVILTKVQNKHLLFSVVDALYQQWGGRVTRHRLRALLDYLRQPFEIDMSIAEANLRRLLDCSESTASCL